MTITIQNPARQIPEERSWKQAMLRGLSLRCPACGKGHLFRAYLKVSDRCPVCGEDFTHQRADDAPPYFTILIAGHILVPLVWIVEKVWKPSLTIHMLIWTPATLALCLGLMPVVKGAVVGLQWALRMHGFDPNAAPGSDGSQ
jgi:uncharacterized protein (DUF983 family)